MTSFDITGIFMALDNKKKRFIYNSDDNGLNCSSIITFTSQTSKYYLGRGSHCLGSAHMMSTKSLSETV